MASLLDKSLTLVALRWMVLAQAFSLLLHVTRMPIALLVLMAVCVIWRIQVIRGHWRLPNSPVKVVMALIGLAIILISFPKITVNAAVNFLLLTFGLKLIELHTQRDAYISLFLSFLVVAVSFLFETALWMAFIVFIVCIVITCALISMHRLEAIASWKLIRQASMYWLAAIPFMVVLFVFFPRLTPLWSMDLGQSARTGLSDSMRPGDIASLTQSDELAFRVTFPEGLPQPAEGLYWRALVMDFTDGRGWQRLKPVNYAGVPVDWFGEGRSRWQGWRNVEGPFYPYDVIMEATHQTWLYSLDGAVAEQPDVGLNQDFMLQYAKPIRQNLRYSSQMPTKVNREVAIAQWRGKRELQLPENENPRTKALALEFWQETGDVPEFVNKVLTYFVDNQFSYTLRPPQLGEKANDEFLFETRRGFCGHYAGALALMARYAGIPARVVAGYLGGDWNSDGKYLTVRQYSAHAWAEVWMPNQGWVRVDPTSVISPERIQQGLAEAMREEGSFLEGSLLSPFRYQGIAFMDSIRSMINDINYQWSLRVVGFDVKKQSSILSDLTKEWGRYSWVFIGGLIVLSLMLPFLVFGMYRLYKHLKQKRTLKEKFDRALFKLLIQASSRKPNYDEMNVSFAELQNQTPRQLFQELGACYPQRTQEVSWLLNQYEMLCYGHLSSASIDQYEKYWQFMIKRLKHLDTK